MLILRARRGHASAYVRPVAALLGIKECIYERADPLHLNQHAHVLKADSQVSERGTLPPGYNATGSLFPSAVDRISLQGTVKPHRFKPVQAAMGCAEVPGVCIATGSAAQGSALGARVNCNDAAGQILVFDAREARVLNHGRKVLLRRELPDGLHQVLVALLVIRHKPAITASYIASHMAPHIWRACKPHLNGMMQEGGAS